MLMSESFSRFQEENTLYFLGVLSRLFSLTRYRFNWYSLSHIQPENSIGIDVSIDERR